MSLHLRDTQAPDQSNDILGRFIKASVRFLAFLLVEQSFISLAQAYDRELEFVKNNVSSRPFVEFRARGPQLKDKPLEPKHWTRLYSPRQGTRQRTECVQRRCRFLFRS